MPPWDSCWCDGLGQAHPTSGRDHFGFGYGVAPGAIAHWKIRGPANAGRSVGGKLEAWLPHGQTGGAMVATFGLDRRMTIRPEQEVLHLWCMQAEGIADARLRRWQAWLSDAEQERAARFRFDSDRAHYVAAHALTRCLLARLGGCRPEQIRFEAGPFGKPEIAGAGSIRFNLSHTRGLVAAAACAGGELGLDVEDAGRMRTELDVARRFFAPSEVQQLMAVGEPERTSRFFRFWTLKESFIKATGEGLRRPLDSFAFTLDPFGVKIFAGTVAGARDDPAAWRFWERRPSARHHLAIALRGGPAMIEIRETSLSHEDL